MSVITEWLSDGDDDPDIKPLEWKQDKHGKEKRVLYRISEDFNPNTGLHTIHLETKDLIALISAIHMLLLHYDPEFEIVEEPPSEAEGDTQ